MDKLIAPNATRILLNDRFTMLGNRKSRSRSRSHSVGRSASRNRSWQSNPDTGIGSFKNRKLVENLERKLKLRAALRLKKRSIQRGSIRKNRITQPNNAVDPRTTIKRIIKGGRRRFGRPNNMTYDLSLH